MDIDYNQRKLIKSQFKILIETRNWAELDSLLADAANLTLLKSERHFDPFVIAIKCGNIEMIDYLIEKGFKLNSGCANNTLISENKSDLISGLNKRKIDEINEEENYDSTVIPNEDNLNVELNRAETGGCYSNPLIEAIKACNYECVRKLIDLNVSLNSNNYKHVPLQIAYNIYSQERDKFFLAQNANSTTLKFEVCLLFKQ
jgi:hypothetical protein